MQPATEGSRPVSTGSARIGLHPLLRASGVDPAEAIACGEASRYGIFGALVLFTTAMSTAVVLWAVTIATDAPLSLAVMIAALWGFGIFHIDRWLVSAHVDRPGVRHRLWLLAPRLAIAVPMGLLVAWFAMLGVAGKEIDQQLDKDRVATTAALADQIRGTSDLARQRALLEAEKAGLRERYDAAVGRIEPLQRAYDEECAGTGGTRSKGCGPVAERKLAELAAAKDDRDAARTALDARTPEIDRAVAALDRQIADRVAEVSRSTERNDGVFARRAALSTVLARDRQARRLYHLLEIVLVVVDIIPAVAKVMSPVSMLDVARSIRRRRLREELEAGASAERESAEIDEALAYAAGQRAATLRDQADARRRADLDRAPARTVSY
jgi:hypothetical protein